MWMAREPLQDRRCSHSCLIRKNQRLTFTILADGSDIRLTCESPLIDVAVHETKTDERVRSTIVLASKTQIITAIIVVAVIVALGILLTRFAPPETITPQQSPVSSSAPSP